MLKLEITKEIIKLIPFIIINNNEDENRIEIEKNIQFNLGSHLLEDMAFILGKLDKAISNTEDDPEGRAFDDETEKELLAIYNYIKTNLYLIETLVHQFAVKGGLSEGVYVADEKDLLWTKRN